MTSNGNDAPSSLWDGLVRAARFVLRFLSLATVVLMLAGCAGQNQTGAGAASGYCESAPVEIIRVLDREFVRDPAVPNAATPLIESPVALTVAANGDMVIADRNSGRILKTDRRGNLLGSVAYFDARGLSSTRAPRFVRTDYTGNVYVSDAVNARISIYDSRLRPVTSLSPPYEALELPEGSVSGLAFGTYGEFYMADLFNGRIYRFDASGRYLAQFPGDEEALPPLNRPMGLACADLDGAVYVCESGNAQIVVFDNLGAQVRTFGGSELKDPVAIALDQQGRYFVADAALDAVVVFTREGRFLGRLDAGRIGFADFTAPTDVTISDASLYIADPSHGRILQIRFGAETLAP